MCLAIPMRIAEILPGGLAVAGDHVIVHAGYAIEKLDEEEARARLDLFAELAAGARSG